MCDGERCKYLIFNQTISLFIIWKSNDLFKFIEHNSQCWIWLAKNRNFFLFSISLNSINSLRNDFFFLFVSLEKRCLTFCFFWNEEAIFSYDDSNEIIEHSVWLLAHRKSRSLQLVSNGWWTKIEFVVNFLVKMFFIFKFLNRSMQHFVFTKC